MFSFSKDNDQYRYSYLQEDPVVFTTGENTEEKIFPKSHNYPGKIVVDMVGNDVIIMSIKPIIIARKYLWIEVELTYVFKNDWKIKKLQSIQKMILIKNVSNMK